MDGERIASMLNSSSNTIRRVVFIPNTRISISLRCLYIPVTRDFAVNDRQIISLYDVICILSADGTGY